MLCDRPASVCSRRRFTRFSAEEFAAQSKQSLHDAIRRAAAAGVGWIQIREKDLEARPLLDLVRFAVAETHARLARVFSSTTGWMSRSPPSAAGIHLGEKFLPLETVSEWRRSAGRPDFLIGSFLPFAGVSARGGTWRGGLRFFWAGICDAVQGGIRRRRRE